MKKALLSLLIFLFTLPCFAQLVEDFENTTGIAGPLPATWTLASGNWAVFERNTPANLGTSQSWGINAFAAPLAYQGTNCASVSRENIGMGNTSEDYLATPLTTIPLNGRLHFFTRTFTSGNQGTTFRVNVAPATAIQSNPLPYSLVQEWTENTLTSNFNIYEEKIVDLSNYAGQSVYIAFERVFQQPSLTIDGDRWLIDNVSVSSDEDCFPMNLSATSPSNTSIYLSWNYVNVSSSEVLLLPCSAIAPVSTDTGTVVNSNNYLFTGLTPGTCYKSLCKRELC